MRIHNIKRSTRKKYSSTAREKAVRIGKYLRIHNIKLYTRKNDFNNCKRKTPSRTNWNILTDIQENTAPSNAKRNAQAARIRKYLTIHNTELCTRKNYFINCKKKKSQSVRTGK